MHVLIVGASVAGITTADALRTEGFGGRITVLDAEPHLPYDKPPLSKLALTPDWNEGRGLLRAESFYKENQIDLILGRRVERLDTDRTTAILETGEQVSADAVVLAPGMRARELPAESMLPGVWSIRNRADSDGLRAALAGRPRVVVIGGGFVGAESASTALSLGSDVTVVEAQGLPFLGLFGGEVAAALAQLQTGRGITLRTGALVERLEGDGRVEKVVLTDGTVLPADVVVLGLGADPAVDWLRGSNLDLDDGIACDEFGRTGVSGVYAAGDAAAWWDPPAGRYRRIEHWTRAREQGGAVAHNIARPESPLKGVAPVPYFWSDQFGHRIQFLGTTEGHDSVTVVHGRLDGDEFVALYSRAGVVTGALGMSAARHLMPFRTQIAAGASLESVLEPPVTSLSGSGE